MSAYWEKILNRRVGRRRAIVATGGTAAAAAFLAACGGDDNKSSGSSSSSGGSSGSGPASGGSGASGASGSSGSASSLLFQGADTTASAKKGGVWKANLTGDPQNMDLYNFDPFSQGFANVIGTKLVILKPSRMQDPGSAEVQGDGAQSWEIAADKLSVTFKMHPSAKWSPLSPTAHAGAPSTIANRQIDSGDVLFAWDRFKQVSSNASEFDAIKNPNAPVVSVEAPDSSTVVFKLNKPYSPLLVQLANPSVSYFYILPKEATDFNKYIFGSGPFYLDDFQPSVKLVLKRNPNYELRDELKRPFVDQVDMPIVSDPANLQAQFRAGQIYGGSAGQGGFTTEDVLSLKKDIPALNMWATPDSSSTVEWFGMAAEGPWKDKRVRQAVQYSWDRDTFIDVAFAVDKLDAAGIPSNKRWNTAIPCGGPGSYMYFPGMWLDPQAKDFGPNAKYFTLGKRADDIAEAKKLLTAAGFPSGIEFNHLQYPIFAVQQQRDQDIVEGMMAEVGLKATSQEKKLVPEIFNYIFSGGNFKEMLNTLDYGGPDVGAFMNAHYGPTGNLFGGWNPNDTGVSKEGDPMLNDMVTKVLGEFDSSKRVAVVQDFQRYMAQMFYSSRYPGGATTLTVNWPVISNWRTFRGFGLDQLYSYEWLDPTKKPLA